MKRLLKTAAFVLCLSSVGAEDLDSMEKRIARVTYYWPGNGGQVGTRTATGKPAVSGKTVAVDPKIIPYGSKVHVPKMGKVLVAMDTGAAVKKRTASRRMGRSEIVIDIFCKNKAEALRRIRQYPLFMTIYIEK